MLQKQKHVKIFDCFCLLFLIWAGWISVWFGHEKQFFSDGFLHSKGELRLLPAHCKTPKARRNWPLLMSYLLAAVNEAPELALQSHCGTVCPCSGLSISAAAAPAAGAASSRDGRDAVGSAGDGACSGSAGQGYLLPRKPIYSWCGWAADTVSLMTPVTWPAACGDPSVSWSIEQPSFVDFG